MGIVGALTAVHAPARPFAALRGRNHRGLAALEEVVSAAQQRKFEPGEDDRARRVPA
ncbi:MAG: hypothetical protein WD929_07330 [Steroidobacteraceae bacterium]